MWRARIGVCVLAFAVVVPEAAGQTYEELKRENEELKARVRALEAAGQGEAVVVSYDAATGRLVVRVGAMERTLVLQPGTHVHDAAGYEVRPADRAAKLTPGVRIEIVEAGGQVEAINIRGDRQHHHPQDHGEHSHAHPAPAGAWRWHDPYYPGWWKPSDNYRPYSWAAPPSEGLIRDLFCAPFVETHRTARGTPWVHPFTIEPPHLHRDLFFFYKYTKDAEGGPTDEHEVELHLDWALTRRLGFALAVPYLGLIGPDEQATGFGDLEIAPRIVIVESETFHLAANIFMTIPTGDAERDLGRGEMSLAPFMTTWHDLGSWAPWTNWNTLYINFGPEIGLETGDTALLYTVVYAHSILGPKLIFPHHHGHGHSHAGHGHDHAGHTHPEREPAGTISVFGPMYPVGLTSFILEFNGQSEWHGDRQTFLQLLTGISYVLTDTAEVRFGVNFPLNHFDQQMDAQYLFAFSYIF
jgi:hypothetical protein